MTSPGTHRSACSYCGTGCGILAHQDRNGHLQVAGDPEHPVNRGMLCSKGMNLHYAMQDRRDRLLVPQMRWSKGHPLQQVSWDTAMQRARSEEHTSDLQSLMRISYAVFCL